MRRTSLTAALVIGLGAMAPAAQEAAAPNRPQDQAQSAGKSYVSRTTAILVDVVVRDKKGRPVTDLKSSEFEVYEDGVRQEIGSFTVVNRGGGIGIGVRFREPGETTIVQTERAESAPPAPEPPPAVTALVFDALSPNALHLTQQAALEYVPTTGEIESRVAVFATVPSMHLVQPFTNDIGKLRAAIRSIPAAGTQAEELRRDRVASLNAERDALDNQIARIGGLQIEGGTALQGQGSAIGQLSADLQIVEGNKRLVTAFDNLDREHRGFGAITTLLSVIESMSLEPGRKTVLLFSEGLPASPALQAQFQQIIERANRANVTVYAVDAAGLRVTSTLEDTRREVVATANDRLRQVNLGIDSTEGPYTRMLEKAEDLLRFDPQAGLARLAEDTGGFLVRDTNNLGSAFKRIDEDSRMHYLLTYSPTNSAFDGKFRTIEVKVTRPDVRVFSRKGYRAVGGPSMTGPPAYEAPAVALLDSGKLPNAFPVRAGGLVFPDREGAIVPLIVKVGTSAFQFEEDAEKGTYSGQAAIVVRIRDDGGQIVHKASQQYVLSGDLKDVEAAKQGEILFYREPRLAPGFYEVESIVYDIVGQRASARVSTLEVPPAAADELQLSSVMIVSKTERVEEGSAGQVAAPLYYGDVLMYPNLGDPISRSADGEVSFYVTVYPAGGRPVQQARLELLRNGRQLATAPLEVTAPQPGADRIQHVGRLPLAQVPPGTYELRIAVSDGKTERSKSAFFKVTG